MCCIIGPATSTSMAVDGRLAALRRGGVGASVDEHVEAARPRRRSRRRAEDPRSAPRRAASRSAQRSVFSSMRSRSSTSVRSSLRSSLVDHRAQPCGDPLRRIVVDLLDVDGLACARSRARGRSRPTRTACRSTGEHLLRDLVPAPLEPVGVCRAATRLPHRGPGRAGARADRRPARGCGRPGRRGRATCLRRARCARRSRQSSPSDMRLTTVSTTAPASPSPARAPRCDSSDTIMSGDSRPTRRAMFCIAGSS